MRSEVSRHEVREWSESLASRKPVVANRAFAVLRRCYEWALGRDVVQSSPFVGIHKPATELPRDKVLSDAEIRVVFQALRAERPIIVGLWEVLFHTGVRPGTPLAVRWSHIDLMRKVWEVPVTKKARGNPEGTGHPLVDTSTGQHKVGTATAVCGVGFDLSADAVAQKLQARSRPQNRLRCAVLAD